MRVYWSRPSWSVPNQWRRRGPVAFRRGGPVGVLTECESAREERHEDEHDDDEGAEGAERLSADEARDVVLQPPRRGKLGAKRILFENACVGGHQLYRILGSMTE